MNLTSNPAPVSTPAPPAQRDVKMPLFRKLKSLFGRLWPARNPGNHITRSRSRLGKKHPEKPGPEPKYWKVASGCVAGTSHLSQGRQCDDAVGSFVAGNLLGIAVADGAGSAKRGGLGATVAVRAALAALQHSYLIAYPANQETAPNLLASAFRCALKSLTDEAARCALRPSDLACTLIVVLSDGTFVTAGQVGDGAVVVGSGASELLTLSEPTNGEFANETALLGCGDFVDLNLSTVANHAIGDIAVCTDGIQRLALEMPAAAPHRGFFAPLFRGLSGLTEIEAERTLTDFLQSPLVAARTDDDKTLLVARFSRA